MNEAIRARSRTGSAIGHEVGAARELVCIELLWTILKAVIVIAVHEDAWLNEELLLRLLLLVGHVDIAKLAHVGAVLIESGREC